MKRLYSIADRIRRGEPIPPVLAALLTSATPVVRLGMWRRERMPRVRVPAYVISFGNITVGGTGKTPAVIARAQEAIAEGRRVAIITRGYGSRRVAEPAALEPGLPAPAVTEHFGDEATLMARRVPEARVVKSADRTAGARFAIEQLGCDTLILDDGYQFLPLERDENVLVIDATNPFGGERLLPRGILRESLDAMRRATAILLTRCDQASRMDATVARIREICPSTPLRLTRHAPKRLWRVCDGQESPLEALRGREIRAWCAIGNPDAFFATLEALGARLAARTAHRDHAAVTSIPASAAGWTVVTEKDAMRLVDPPAHVYALGVDMEDFT